MTNLLTRHEDYVTYYTRKEIMTKEELEKENAELKENKFLKEQCLILADGNVCNSTCSEIKKQLNKAKKIIKDFILMAKVEHLKDRYETVDEAEQFIKE